MTYSYSNEMRGRTDLVSWAISRPRGEVVVRAWLLTLGAWLVSATQGRVGVVITQWRLVVVSWKALGSLCCEAGAHTSHVCREPLSLAKVAVHLMSGLSCVVAMHCIEDLSKLRDAFPF